MINLLQLQKSFDKSIYNWLHLLFKGSYAIGDYITEDNVEYLQLMPNDIYYEYALAMTTKTWMLKQNLDTMILNIVQSGMQKYWENQVINQLKHFLYRWRIHISKYSGITSTRW